MPHGRLIDLTGQRFGRWLVTGRAERPAHLQGNHSYWNCVCDCGTARVVVGRVLRYGLSNSCGCLHAENSANRLRTHGYSPAGNRHPLYKIWRGVLDRCYNPRSPSYEDYGGRGIFVCDRWRHSFPNFLADMGERPPGYTIERIDNDGPYAPDNCRWATRSEQRANQRPRGQGRKARIARLKND